MREADVFMFDEASSFLDVKQRLTATECIRSLVTPEVQKHLYKDPSRYQDPPSRAACAFLK